jgi:hypothetical protein
MAFEEKNVLETLVWLREEAYKLKTQHENFLTKSCSGMTINTTIELSDFLSIFVKMTPK